jgi:hypothetical protein
MPPTGGVPGLHDLIVYLPVTDVDVIAILPTPRDSATKRER